MFFHSCIILWYWTGIRDSLSFSLGVNIDLISTLEPPSTDTTLISSCMSIPIGVIMQKSTSNHVAGALSRASSCHLIRWKNDYFLSSMWRCNCHRIISIQVTTCLVEAYSDLRDFALFPMVTRFKTGTRLIPHTRLFDHAIFWTVKYNYCYPDLSISLTASIDPRLSGFMNRANNAPIPASPAAAKKA